MYNYLSPGENKPQEVALFQSTYFFYLNQDYFPNLKLQVDYEALEAKLERSRPRKHVEKAPPREREPTPQHQHSAGPDLAAMGITPEVMAQLMSQGINKKDLMNMSGFQPKSKPVKNDPAQQKVQLINLRTFQKLDKKKCPELYGLESFLKKNPDYFVATEAKDFVLKHPKYFPRTMYQRIQPDLNDPMAQLNMLGADPKMMQALMMQAQMDPKAMSVLGAQQAMGQLNDPKLMAMLDKNTQMAMAQMAQTGMDQKMLQAMGLGGMDPKMLGMDPKMLGMDPKMLGMDPKMLGMDPKMMQGLGGFDPKMLAALGFANPMDQQKNQNQAAANMMKQQQQQMAMLGMDPKMLGLDPSSLQALLGMGGIDPKQLD